MKKFIFVSAGIIGTLLLLEVLLRMFSPQITIDSILTPWDFPCYQKGVYSSVRLLSNADCLLHSNTGAFADIKVHTNSLGLRNKEFTLTKEPNTKRILFLGDSFTFGWGEPEEASYPRRVEALLQASLPDQPIEVINAGIPSVGIGKYYTYLLHYGLTFHPDIIVVGLHPYSDIAKDVNYSIWKQLDANGLPSAIESSITYVDNVTHTIRLTNVPDKLKLPFLSHSHLFSKFMDIIVPSGSLLTVDDSMTAKPCFFKEQCHDLDDAWQRSLKLLAGIQTLSETNSIPLLMVEIPMEFQLHPDTVPKYSMVPLLPWEYDVPNKKLAAFFEKQHINFLDLLPVFQRHNSDVLYHPLDDHWNDHGHEVAAEALAPRLMEMLYP